LNQKDNALADDDGDDDDDDDGGDDYESLETAPSALDLIISFSDLLLASGRRAFALAP
jgi:hypothetical protein